MVHPSTLSGPPICSLCLSCSSNTVCLSLFLPLSFFLSLFLSLPLFTLSYLCLLTPLWRALANTSTLAKCLSQIQPPRVPDLDIGIHLNLLYFKTACIITGIGKCYSFFITLSSFYYKHPHLYQISSKLSFYLHLHCWSNSYHIRSTGNWEFFPIW